MLDYQGFAGNQTKHQRVRKMASKIICNQRVGGSNPSVGSNSFK